MAIDNKLNPTTPAAALRKFFNDPRLPFNLKELKEFKVEDPDGFAEIGALCVAHYADSAA